MEYHELVMTIPEESRDAVISMVLKLGSIGINESDNTVIAYFPASIDVNLVSEQLNGFHTVLEASGLDPAFSFRFNTLPDSDWNEKWKENFVPIDVGEDLTIIPSWIRHKTGRIPLIIDPGMVFGTGYHETTKRCLVLIEKYCRENAKESFLDIGTGTGILAIAASRLGFGVVIAVDTDPLAVDATKRNADANQLSNIDAIEGDIEATDRSFDMIAANLLSGILVEISSGLVSRLKPKGIAILSGMMDGQEDEVIKEYEQRSLVLLEKVIDGQWVTLVLKKQGNIT